jgi:HEPN domain-containing protein
MKQPIDLAKRFLALADRDIKALWKLAADREIDDEVVGFHAQQAVEKCLKAVLAKHRIEIQKHTIFRCCLSCCPVTVCLSLHT